LGQTKGVGPDTDAGEEMTLGEFTKFLGVKVKNAAFVHHAIGDVAGFD
jgi:hypothetical protein